MDDLVKRLLEPVDDPFFGKVIEPIKWEAANEIERLRSIINDDRLEGAADRIEKLEAALRELSTDWDCCAVSKNMKLIARKALDAA